MEAAAKVAQDEARKKNAERNKKSAEKAANPAGDDPATPQQAVDTAARANTLFGDTMNAGGPHGFDHRGPRK